MTAEEYYRAKHRHHCLRFIAAAALLSNCIVWALVAVMFANATLAIWLCIAAVFFIFMSVIEHGACSKYYLLVQRSTPPTNECED